jgi:hypothetical protein
METRILPRAEWAAALVGTELETIHPILPDGAQVVVVEDAGQVVACQAVYPQIHLEGLWVRPEYRGNPRVARRIFLGMVNAALAMGARSVQTAAVDPGVAGMIERLGAVELPGRHFSLSLCADAKKTAH